MRKMNDLKGFAIGAKDGDIGEASDFIFDDKKWTVRYLVADTERWLPGRRVLISPIVIDRVDWEGKRLPVLLTQDQVKNSPDISLDETLSAQDEIKYYDYYNWPYYWAGGDLWGPVTLPRELSVEGIDRKRRVNRRDQPVASAQHERCDRLFDTGHRWRNRPC